MNPHDMLAVLTSELDSLLTVPVRTSGNTDERPIPIVSVDSYSLSNLNFHNSHYVGSELNNDGDETTRWLRFHYDARIDMTVKEDDDTQAHSLLSTLQSVLGLIVENPQIRLHEDVDWFKMKSSGEVTYQFREPQETELNQSVKLRSFHDVKRDDFSTIAQVQDTFSITN
jgi:hypothetical protein